MTPLIWFAHLQEDQRKLWNSKLEISAAKENLQSLVEWGHRRG
jgi:hypothetical protein